MPNDYFVLFLFVSLRRRTGR